MTSDRYIKLTQAGVGHCKNILEVNVPEKLRYKVKTGIEWFDKASGGPENPGMTPSTVTLLTAVPGGGKTTLGLQLANSITSSKNIALYNTGEESLFQLKMTAERLGVERGFICGEDYMLDDILAHGRELIAQNPSKQLFMFFDSLRAVNDGFYADGAINSMTPGRVVKSIVEFCKETYAIAIIIGHVTKDGKFEGKQKIKHDLDAHCNIVFDIKPKSPTYGLRVFSYSKNRFGPTSIDGTVLDMSAKGLVSLDKICDVGLSDDD